MPRQGPYLAKYTHGQRTLQGATRNPQANAANHGTTEPDPPMNARGHRTTTGLRYNISNNAATRFTAPPHPPQTQRSLP